LNNFVNPRFD